MSNRAGNYTSNLSSDMQYLSFNPAPLPPEPAINYDQELVYLLTAANRSIGTLNGLSHKVTDIELFESMYIRKEALLSSQIEGTQATIDDILDPNIETNINQDIEEVLSYIKASAFAAAKLRELPLCNRLIKETHQILMNNTRGMGKSPGEFRKSQNWIGPGGGSLKEAVFIPPNVPDMNEAMSELEKFINEDSNIDPLIKISLIHYQFETIHPFLDGNGRIGRLLISLFLMEKKVLLYETLYISYYLKRFQREYYDRLNMIRQRGDYEQWIKFFLKAVDTSAVDAVDAIEKLLELHNVNKRRIETVTGREGITLTKVFRYIEHSPIINISKTSKELKISFNAAADAIERLIKLGILRQVKAQKRNRVFEYTDYLEILRSGT